MQVLFNISSLPTTEWIQEERDVLYSYLTLKDFIINLVIPPENAVIKNQELIELNVKQVLSDIKTKMDGKKFENVDNVYFMISGEFRISFMLISILLRSGYKVLCPTFNRHGLLSKLKEIKIHGEEFDSILNTEDIE